MKRALHLAGSARSDCDIALLRDAHTVVAHVIEGWVARGGTIVAGITGGPGHEDDPDLPLIFDGTAVNAVITALRSGGISRSEAGPMLVLRGSRRGYDQMSPQSIELLSELTDADVLDLRLLPDTWRSGALIRREQAQSGGILLTLSGGAGVEDLVNLYAADGRPIVPVDVDLGSAQRDGAQGGGTGLARRALAQPTAFLQLAGGAPPGARLAALRMGPARPSPTVLADRLLALLDDLEPPRAFCVRLLDREHEHFAEVEAYFRDVVDPVLGNLGLRVVDLSRDRQEGAWMNAEIFEHLHRSDTVLADLTGQRPNCYLELGYALGRGHRVVVSARESEDMPFDADKLPWHFWTPGQDTAAAQDELLDHLRKFGARAPLVTATRMVT